MRVGVLAILVPWIIGCVIALSFQDAILTQWKVGNPAAMWFTLPVILFSLTMPMLAGVLQGAQNFFWLGWTLMLNALGRFSFAAIAVLAFGFYAAGMLSGVMAGLLLALAAGVVQTRRFWMLKPSPVDWRPILRQMIPLFLGFAGFQIMFTVDTMFVKAYFPKEQAGYYVSAGTLARALLWVVLPLAAVMFPKLVHSSVKSQKTNLTGLVMLGTAVLSICGAAGLALVGPLIVRIVYKESYLEVATTLLPWYASAMIPLALGNVLLNQLLAKPSPRLSLGIAMLVLACCYLLGLWKFHDSLVTVLKTMGVFNLALLGLCGVFWWLDRTPQRSEPV